MNSIMLYAIVYGIALVMANLVGSHREQERCSNAKIHTLPNRINGNWYNEWVDDAEHADDDARNVRRHTTKSFVLYQKTPGSRCPEMFSRAYRNGHNLSHKHQEAKRIVSYDHWWCHSGNNNVQNQNSGYTSGAMHREAIPVDKNDEQWEWRPRVFRRGNQDMRSGTRQGDNFDKK